MVEQSGVSLSYVWRPSVHGLSIKLNLGVVDRMSLAVRGGAQLLPRRGLEIGGLLLGRMERSRGRTTVWIDGFDLLDCEHVVGPSFILSSDDRRSLASRLRQYSGAESRVVGFFRSHTRKDFAITVEDADLMREYFPKSWMVFLLVRSGNCAAETGTYLAWNQGALNLRPVHEFPLSSEELLSGKYDISDESKPLEAVKHAVSPNTQMAAPLEKTVPAATPAIAHHEQSWVKRWQQAVSRQHHFPLRWMFAGGIVAGALAAYVLQRAPAAESRQWAHTPAVVQRVAPVTPASSERAASDPQTTENLQPGSESRFTGVHTPVQSVAHRMAEVRKFAADAAITPPVITPPEALPDAPQLDTQLRYDIDSPTLPGILTPDPMHVAGPLVRVSVNDSSHARGLLSRVFKQEKQPSYSPPKLVHEGSLAIPPNLEEQVRQHAPIDVKVYVDARGNVTFAELLSDGTGKNRELASLVVFSARHYEFVPARAGKGTVPGEVVLRFQFGSEASDVADRRKRF